MLAFTNAEKELEAVHELKSLVTVDSLTQLPNINTFSMQTWELLKNHPERICHCADGYPEVPPAE